MKRFAIVATILMEIIVVGRSPAQQPDQPVILKATTRLVMLSVIARDKNNQPAVDLAKEDFRNRVNGKTQPISVFSVESSGTLPSSRGLAPISAPATNQPATVFTNRLPAQNATPGSFCGSCREHRIRRGRQASEIFSVGRQSDLASVVSSRLSMG